MNNSENDVTQICISFPRLKELLKPFVKVKQGLLCIKENATVHKKIKEVLDKVKHFTGRNFDVEVFHNT